MGKPKWTAEQREAVLTRDCNILVSAAAGAGKTAVLVERIIRKITGEKVPVDIDKLLVVTFTKAAASEMRERIGAAVAAELAANPDSRHLHRQLILLNRARITTLHSFCLDVLRQYFYKLDLDPAFRVADQGEIVLLRMQALEDLFEECYSSADTGFLNLVDAFGGDRDDLYLQEMVLNLFDFSGSNPQPELWLSNLAAPFRHQEGIPPDGLAWTRTARQWLELQAESCRAKLEKAHALARSPGGPAVYGQTLLGDIALLDDITAALRGSWEGLYLAFNAVDFAKLRTCRDKDVDETVKKKVQALRDEVKKTILTAKSEFFSRTPAEMAEDLNKAAPLVESLIQLTLEFAERYSKIKASRGLVDFQDLEHYCLQILSEGADRTGRLLPSAEALALREYFEEVLVDEYQDINEVQEEILRLISRQGDRNGNRFMVGDVKQSIYRFRLAEPSLFLEKYQVYPRQEGLPDRGIDLTRNFRSRREVVDAVNFVFRQLMTGGISEISYDSKAELVCGSSYPETGDLPCAAGPVELHLLEKPRQDLAHPEPGQEEDRDEDASGSDTVGEADLDSVQREARFVSGRILEMVGGTEDGPAAEFFVYDSKMAGYRPVQFRDIVVLLRTTRNTANIFLEEFRQAGIPAYSELDTGYFEATEVETVVSLLKVIDNPRQDIPLASVLRSPVVGLDAAELASVRIRGQGQDFFDCLINCAGLGEADTDSKLQAFLHKLEGWRTLARQETLPRLIWQLYTDTGLYTYVGGMPGGEQRQANLRALYDRARQYEKTSFRGLFRFLRFLEKFREEGNDLGAARAQGESDNVVRVISIHKSKGLEFPVVFVAGLGRQFNMADTRQKVLFHKELGIGLPVVDLDLKIYYPTLAQTAIKRKIQAELLAEELRTLYVAMTRAREKLILVGSLKSLDKADQWCAGVCVEEWALPDTQIMSARCFLDWLCMAAARHRDGGILRDLGALGSNPPKALGSDPSRWRIGISAPQPKSPDSSTSSCPMELLAKVREVNPVECHDEHTDIISRCFNWRYPHAGAAGKAAKAGVSELKRRFSGLTPEEETEQLFDNTVFRRPAFLQTSAGLSAAEKGSALHLVMQHLRLQVKGLSAKDIRCQITDMTAKELLTEEQAEAVDEHMIYGFFVSPLGQRVMAAEKVRRELAFTMTLPAGQVYDDLGEGCAENILVQGVIDCLAEEQDGSCILIDYKTDRIPGGGAEALADKYRGQLNLYAMAVESLLGKKVREKYIYLFSLGQEVRLG